MNALEQYLKYIDESSYDCEDAHTINSEFQQVIKQLTEEGKQDIVAIADLDRQVFSVRKSFDTKLDIDKGTINGLSWQMGGTQSLEDGSQIPLYWPDVIKFTKQDFEYFEKRYFECKNLYAKTEYGLMVYFGKKTVISKHNNFKKQLFSELFRLSKEYFYKASKGGEKNYYSQYFYITLRLAFLIAEKENLKPELTEVIQFITEAHQNWDITKIGTLRTLLDLSGLMYEFFGIFEKIVNFQEVLNKNLQGAREIEKTYLWGAMYIVDRNIVIEDKRKNPITELLVYKAELYEKLSIEAERNSNLACVGFVEQALRIYQRIKDNESIKRLENLYSDLRGKFSLSEIRQEFPKEYIESQNERILKAISETDLIGVINYIINCPWYDTIQNIKDRSIELSKQFVFSSMLPASIADKFGNTVDVFYSEKEKEDFNFWQSYTFNFQIGTLTMHKFFFEAYKSNKLNFNSVISYLENTWFNEVIERKYHGQTVEVKPIDTLKPVLKRLFEELEISFADNKHQFDYVTVTDSLTLKVEGLLRYFCEKIGIATFKTKPNRQRNSDNIVMEKLLDDLLADIAHKPGHETNFDEEDRYYIKYVMSEKIGLNLRNKVAHSLMDIFEYSFEHIVVLFCIIMKLSKYKFIETKGEIIS